MKIVKKVLGIIGICLLLLLLALPITGFEPTGRTPGLWLKGELVNTPVTDWAFTDKIETIMLQTNTKWGIPHSVTTYNVAYNGQLYLTSVYRKGMVYPHGRSWNENIVRDPRVRLKIGDKLYDRKLVLLTDAAVRDEVIKLKRIKYPKQVIAATSTINVFHVLDN